MEPLGSFTNDSKIDAQEGHLLTFFGTRSCDHSSFMLKKVHRVLGSFGFHWCRFHSSTISKKRPFTSCSFVCINPKLMLFKLADRMRSMRTNGASKNRDWCYTNG